MNTELKSWPERIWLQHGFEYLPEFEVAYRTNDEITWCQDSVEEHNIEYVRADLAQPVSAGLPDAIFRAVDELCASWVHGGNSDSLAARRIKARASLEIAINSALLSAAQRDSQPVASADAHDAELYRFATALEDNAEVLYGAVLNNWPDQIAIRNEIAEAMAASKEPTQ
jgi:hypothetical protein